MKIRRLISNIRKKYIGKEVENTEQIELLEQILLSSKWTLGILTLINLVSWFLEFKLF